MTRNLQPQRSAPVGLRSWPWVVACLGWSVLVASLGSLSLHSHRNDLLAVAASEARSAFEKDLVYRRWAARHGGVYVPVSEHTPPNPALAHLPERDVTTTSGRRLTLVNPAYMTRQVHELGRAHYGIQGHITSLRPLRPENAPDDWERGALEAIAKGAAEIAAVAPVGGEPHLRTMRPLFTEESCLKCHATQGYAQGDLRGGISVSVPLGPLEAAYAGTRHDHLVSFASLWLVGLGGLLGVRRHVAGQYRLLGETLDRVAASEERFHKAFHRAPVMVALTELSNGRFLEVNQSLVETTGYPREELLGSTSVDLGLIAAEDRQALLERVRQGGRGQFEGLRFLTREGRELYCDTTCEVVSVDGADCLLSIFQDVTARRRAEADLRRASREWETTFDALADCVWILDAEGTILRSNQATRRLLGQEPQAVCGRHCWEVVHGSDGPPPKCPVRILRETRRRESMEFPQGGRWLEVTVDPILDEAQRLVGVVHVVSDITVRKEAAEQTLQALERSRGQQAALAALTTHPSLHSGDLQTLSRALTERAVAALGVERAGVWLLGSGEAPELRCLDLFAEPAGRHTSGGVLPWAACVGGLEVLAAVPYLAADEAQGDPRLRGCRASYLEPLGITALLDVPIRAEGRTIGVLRCERVGPAHRWVADEIAFVRQLADQLALTAAHGEARLAQTEREKLQTQVQQLQKMESIGTLAGGVAHDFNNMLGVILGNAELALSHLGRASPAREYLEQVVAAATRSAGITRQLLAFARKETVSPRVVEVDAAVEAMLKMLRRLVGEDLEVVWEPGAEGARVRIDPSQLDQILANLAVNARDAIAGVGRVSIRTGAMRIRPEDRDAYPEAAPGEYVFLEVSDTGCGIRAEDLGQIFEPFFTTKEAGKGTGLGLAMVYGAARQNGGFVQAESQLGQGTTLRVALPRVAAAGTGVEEDPEEPRGAGETLLVVEDEAANRRILQKTLTALGYRVLVADGPRVALDLARSQTEVPALLVTDVVMPEMNGRELAEALDRFCPRTKVLYVSGYAAGHIAERGILDGSVHLLQKPFTRKELARAVRRALEA